MRRSNNATTMSIATKKEETKMKKAAAAKKSTTTNKEETAMKKTTTAAKSTTNKEEKNMKNSLIINGIEITLTAEQSAAIAAMLMGGTTTASAPEPEAPKKKGRKAKEVKAEPKEQAESVKKAADEPFTDFKVMMAESRFSFAKADGTFLYQKAPRQALNNRLKALCESKGLSVKYNKEVWAWEVLNPRTGKVPGRTVLAGIVKELSVPVSTDELAAVYAEWEAAKAKRNNK